MELQPIQSKIYEIRGQRVMLDFDLAELYQVETKRLKEAVRRNIERFEGDDFMFVLSEKEYEILRTQIATSSLTSQNASSNWGGRRYPPFAFTEMGVAMLSSVLRSETAIRVNRAIMRAFVAMRNLHHDHDDSNGRIGRNSGTAGVVGADRQGQRRSGQRSIGGYA